MFRHQQSQKRSGIKKGIDNDDSRRKRADITIELRKKNREEQLQKRRMNSTPQFKQTNDENSNSLNLSQHSTALPKLTKADIQKRLSNMNELVCAVKSNDPAERLRATVEFRRMLSVEDSPPIQSVINSGVVPALMRFLSFNHEEKLQFEAAWTITNIASGTTAHTKCVVDHGGVQHFVQLLGSPNAEVREQAVWALGNIAGDSPEFRDLVLKTGNSMQRLIAILGKDKRETKLTMIRNTTWCMSNFCRGKPKPQFEQIKMCIPVLAKLLMERDNEVLTDSCWALSYVTDDQTTGNLKIEAVVRQPEICTRLIYLLQHGTSQVQIPALRTIGNIVTGDDHQTEIMLKQNPLPALLGMLSCQKKSLRKETCWTISNITAGTPLQIQQVINANLIPPLVNILKEDQFDVQKEAAWAISNIASGGTESHTRFLVSQAAIPAICSMLKCGDAKMIMVVLDAMTNILKVGKKDANGTEDNKYAEMVEECGGLDTLEELQQHENEDVYHKSVKILLDFFESDEDDGMGMAPEIDPNGGQFAFGMGDASQSSQFINASQGAQFNF